MAKVKIYVGRNETVGEVEDDLYKALDFHVSGDAHNEDFDDPAMVSVKNQMLKLHEAMYQSMLQDIFEALNEDFKR